MSSARSFRFLIFEVSMFASMMQTVVLQMC